MSKSEDFKRQLQGLREAHHHKTEILPAGDFTASVMRSVRNLESENQAESSRFESFLWQMTMVPASCAAVIFLVVIGCSGAFERDVVSGIAGAGLAPETLAIRAELL